MIWLCNAMIWSVIRDTPKIAAEVSLGGSVSNPTMLWFKIVSNPLALEVQS